MIIHPTLETIEEYKNFFDGAMTGKLLVEMAQGIRQINERIPHEKTEVKESEKKDIPKGYVLLAHFTQNTLLPGKGAFLTPNQIHGYFRNYRMIFKECFLKFGARNLIYVHPENLLTYLMQYGTKQIKSDIKEYLGIHKKQSTYKETGSEIHTSL